MMMINCECVVGLGCDKSDLGRCRWFMAEESDVFCSRSA